MSSTTTGCWGSSRAASAIAADSRTASRPIAVARAVAAVTGNPDRAALAEAYAQLRDGPVTPIAGGTDLMVALTGIVSREGAEKAVLSRVPEAFVELNRKAFQAGYDKALQARGK